MPIGALLTSWNGRISRGPWWGAVVSLNIAVFAIAFVVALISLGTSSMPDMADLGAGAWIAIILVALPAQYMMLAVGAKRLHDRGKGAIWVVPFYVVPSVLNLLTSIGGESLAALNFVVLILVIWGTVEQGILAGQPGPNQYGPSPKGAAPYPYGAPGGYPGYDPNYPYGQPQQPYGQPPYGQPPYGQPYDPNQQPQAGWGAPPPGYGQPYGGPPPGAAAPPQGWPPQPPQGWPPQQQPQQQQQPSQQGGWGAPPPNPPPGDPNRR